ncbi:MAG: insulinase family protein [Ruminococcaceae bacterium]|nr:insulinase family protein [Oscillospiraceae bacterium]
MNPIVLPIGRQGRLIYLNTDRFKSELLAVSFTAPLAVETAQQNAMVMALARRGTAGYPGLASLNRRLDELYSTAISTSNRRTGDMQTLGFAADFLGARYVGGGLGLLPEVTDMLAELLCRPLFDERGCFTASFVESEKQNLRDAIRAAIHNPRGYAISACRKLLCAGEPYALSVIGSEDTVDALTPEGLAARYRELVSSIAPVFSYVGSTPAAEVAALLEARFSDFGGTPAPYTASVHGGSGLAEKVEEMPLMQGKLSLGFRTDVSLSHPLAPAMLYLNEIFGGSPASKLFLNVRERMSLCYHCSSSLDLYKGILFANSGMKVENRAVAEEAMLQQLADIKAGRISDTELLAARRSIEHSYRQSGDNPGVLARFYTGRILAGNGETVEEWQARLDRVTLPDIVEAAAHVAHRATFFLKGTKTGEEDEEE